MSCYRRVAVKDRYQIQAYLQSNVPVIKIAKSLGFNKSTIYREAKRNASIEGYFAEAAHGHAKVRFARCRRKLKMVGELEALVVKKIASGWTPDHVSGRFRLENVASLSHETIYRYIRSRATLKPQFFQGLRRFTKSKKGQSRGTRKKPAWMLTIHDRPSVINGRKTLGHWERDGMFVKNKRQVLVCIERKSRYTKIAKVKEPYCLHITQQAEKLMGSTGKFLSITNDNGNEFMDAPYFKVPVYYCDPKKPHQRGSVENAIGLLRQYLPSETDLNDVTDDEMQEIENKLNHRPRRCLDYRTPYEVFFNQKVALAI